MTSHVNIGTSSADAGIGLEKGLWQRTKETARTAMERCRGIIGGIRNKISTALPDIGIPFKSETMPFDKPVDKVAGKSATDAAAIMDEKKAFTMSEMDWFSGDARIFDGTRGAKTTRERVLDQKVEETLHANYIRRADKEAEADRKARIRDYQEVKAASRTRTWGEKLTDLWRQTDFYHILFANKNMAEQYMAIDAEAAQSGTKFEQQPSGSAQFGPGSLGPDSEPPEKNDRDDKEEGHDDTVADDFFSTGDATSAPKNVDNFRDLNPPVSNRRGQYWRNLKDLIKESDLYGLFRSGKVVEPEPEILIIGPRARREAAERERANRFRKGKKGLVAVTFASLATMVATINDSNPKKSATAEATSQAASPSSVSAVAIADQKDTVSAVSKVIEPQLGKFELGRKWREVDTGDLQAKVSTMRKNPNPIIQPDVPKPEKVDQPPVEQPPQIDTQISQNVEKMTALVAHMEAYLSKTYNSPALRVAAYDPADRRQTMIQTGVDRSNIESMQSLLGRARDIIVILRMKGPEGFNTLTQQELANYTQRFDGIISQLKEKAENDRQVPITTANDELNRLSEQAVAGVEAYRSKHRETLSLIGSQIQSHREKFGQDLPPCESKTCTDEETANRLTTLERKAGHLNRLGELHEATSPAPKQAAAQPKVKKKAEAKRSATPAAVTFKSPVTPNVQQGWYESKYQEVIASLNGVRDRVVREQLRERLITLRAQGVLAASNSTSNAGTWKENILKRTAAIEAEIAGLKAAALHSGTIRPASHVVGSTYMPSEI